MGDRFYCETCGDPQELFGEPCNGGDSLRRHKPVPEIDWRTRAEAAEARVASLEHNCALAVGQNESLIKATGAETYEVARAKIAAAESENALKQIRDVLGVE